MIEAQTRCHAGTATFTVSGDERIRYEWLDSRFRPVLPTTVTTMGGLVPVLYKLMFRVRISNY